MKDLTQAELKRILHYCPDSGLFKWKIKAARKLQIGDFAGSKSKSGYHQIMINGSNYLAHRLAWLYINGELPEQVDHINHIRNDNRWINLRAANAFINNQNQGLSPRNNFNITGITFIYNRYLVRMNVNKKVVYLGRYKDFFEACCARKAAEFKYGFHENHGLKIQSPIDHNSQRA